MKEAYVFKETTKMEQNELLQYILDMSNHNLHKVNKFLFLFIMADGNSMYPHMKHKQSCFFNTI